MATRLNIPSVVGLNLEGLPVGLAIFLQAVQDALNVLDRNAVYKDAITAVVPSMQIRGLSAQGQAFSVSSVSVASGADYAALVQDVRAILVEVANLRAAVEAVTNQLSGR